MEMEKDSTIIFPESHPTSTSPGTNAFINKKNLKWCLAFLVLTAFVVQSMISVWLLQRDVQELEKNMLAMQLKQGLHSEVLRELNVLKSRIQEIEKAQNIRQNFYNLEDIQGINEFAENFEENAKNLDENPLLLDSEDDDLQENYEAPLSEGETTDIYEIDGLDNDDTNVVKRKREIRDYSEGSAEKAIKNETENKSKREKSSTESLSSVEKSFETSSKERFFPTLNTIYVSSTRKPHVHRKHRKSRIGSAERFFTETHSTTTTPIQVRQSRTKITQVHSPKNIDKSIRLHTQKFQQHTSSNKDTITKEEALRRGFARHSDEVSYDLDTSKERGPDALSYNMITIHFSADTSHYSRERDPHYFGNGRMQIKSEVYKDWKPAHWTQGVGMSKYFHLHQGRVTVSTTGIYLIYAQIQYSNVQEVNGFSVFRNKEVVVQCITTSTHPDKHEIKSNTCGISTTILLQSNDSVCIKDLHHGRYVVLTPEKSYFGLVLLSPFKN